MRIGLLLAAVLAAVAVTAGCFLVQAAPATAQEIQRPTVRGLFGDRVLGQPLQPKASTRFNTIDQRGLLGAPTQTGAAAGTMFATPWRRGESASLQMLWGTPVQSWQPEPALNTASSTQTQPLAAPAVPPQTGQTLQYGQLPQDVQPVQQPTGPTAEGTLTPIAGNGAFSGSPGAAGFGAAEVAPGAEGTAAATSGAAPLVVRRVLSDWTTSGQPDNRASSVPATGLKPQPAPELSAKITRLARAGGVQSPSGIEVTMLGTTAIVQGTVGSQYQRTLVANLLRLEPGVWQVDNKLTVAQGVGPAPR